MRARWISLFAVGAIALLTGPACSGDGDGGSAGAGGSSGSGTGGSSGSGTGGSSGTATGGSSGTTSTGGSSGTTATGGSAGSGTGGSAGGSALEQCKAEAATNPNPACANCACDHCLTQLTACQQDPKCVALRTCAQSKCPDCSEICVLTNCGNELNEAGGLGGESTAKAIAIRDCTDQNQCNCCTQ